MKIAVLIYPHFSLYEITALTAGLTVWFGQELDFLGSEIKPYISEDGFHVLPTKKVSDVDIASYDCVILPGIMNPLPALYDDELIAFLRKAKGTNTLLASISSSPLLLAKAGLLDDVRFTAGVFVQMADHFPFLNMDNCIHQPIAEDGNVITAIGFAFREFACSVLRRLGFEVDESFMGPVNREYTKEELTFVFEEADYKEFAEDLKPYEAK